MAKNTASPAIVGCRAPPDPFRFSARKRGFATLRRVSSNRKATATVRVRAGPHLVGQLPRAATADISKMPANGVRSSIRAILLPPAAVSPWGSGIIWRARKTVEKSFEASAGREEIHFSERREVHQSRG